MTMSDVAGLETHISKDDAPRNACPRLAVAGKMHLAHWCKYLAMRFESAFAHPIDVHEMCTRGLNTLETRMNTGAPGRTRTFCHLLYAVSGGVQLHAVSRAYDKFGKWRLKWNAARLVSDVHDMCTERRLDPQVRISFLRKPLQAALVALFLVPIWGCGQSPGLMAQEAEKCRDAGFAVEIVSNNVGGRFVRCAVKPECTSRARSGDD
jgi:hypothetical protein